MLLRPPSAPHSATKFSAPAAVGLRSLLLPPDAVVARAAAARCRCRCGGGEGVAVVEASEDSSKNANKDDDDAEDGNCPGAAKEKEAGIMISAEEDEEMDGFWVSYGRRRPRRRLPPPIPSLVARGALRRTRTGDGRLVVRIVPVVRPECIRARRGRGGDRLTMRLVEHEDDSTMMAPPLREPGGKMAAASSGLHGRAAAARRRRRRAVMEALTTTSRRQWRHRRPWCRRCLRRGCPPRDASRMCSGSIRSVQARCTRCPA